MSTTFDISTELGPMTVTASYWQERPTDYNRQAKFTLAYKFADLTINRISYSGEVHQEYYQPHNSDPARDGQFERGGLHFYVKRTGQQWDSEMTGNARSQIVRAVRCHSEYCNITTLLETARQTHAQAQANRQIEKARKHLEQAQEWAKHMAPADARHYERGFTIESAYDEASDAA